MQKWEQIQGVYIHTPFCLQKCLYCDFASYAGADTETMEKYVDAVCSEIMMRSNEVTIADQATLYFGGGTPSLLSEKLLAKLVEALQKMDAGCSRQRQRLKLIQVLPIWISCVFLKIWDLIV